MNLKFLNNILLLAIMACYGNSHLLHKAFKQYISNDKTVMFLNQAYNTSLLSEYISSTGILIRNGKELEIFLKTRPASEYDTRIFALISGIDEAAEFLTKFSTIINKQGTTVRKNIKNLQVLFIVTVIGKSYRRESEMELEIREKLNAHLLRQFDMSSSILLGFPVYLQSENTSTDDISFDIWEIYSVKSVSIVKRLKNGLKIENLEIFLQLESRRVSTRQDWHGIDIQTLFMVSGITKENGNFSRIKGVTKFEVDLLKNSTTGRLNLKPSLSAKLLWDFETALNFTLQFRNPLPYSSGFETPWSNQTHTFDIIGSHFSLVPQKLKLAQHLEPTYFNSIAGFFVQPPAYTFRNIYIAPFTTGLWSMIFITWMTIGLCFHGVRWLRRIVLRTNDEKFDDHDEIEKDEQVTSECLWWAIATSCQQGWYVTPTTTPTRIIFATGLLFSLICYAAYSAAIVSELWDTTIPLRSLEAVIANSKNVYVESGSDISKIVVEDLIQKNSKYLSKFKRRTTTHELLKRMLLGKTCFINWPEYFIEDAKEMLKKTINNKVDPLSKNLEVRYCEKFSSFPYKYIPTKASMFVHKESPLYKILNYRILIGREIGLIHRYWMEYLRKTSIRCLKKSNKTYALGLYDTWAVFATLFAGFVISLSILPIEIMCMGQIIVPSNKNLIM